MIHGTTSRSRFAQPGYSLALLLVRKNRNRMRYQGRITSWKDEKGFGFITPSGGGAQVFLHISSFLNRQRRPAGNEIITYELRIDGKGRAQAEAVAFVGEQAISSSSSVNSIIPTLFACGFLVFVVASVFLGKVPTAVLALYVVASIVTFIVYAFDKSAAQSNRWRTPEGNLRLLALIGGWPGALAAQRLLRHKSNKTSFQIVFWATVFINCGVLGWLFTPSGATVIRSIHGVA